MTKENLDAFKIPITKAERYEIRVMKYKKSKRYLLRKHEKRKEIFEWRIFYKDPLKMREERRSMTQMQKNC